MPAHALATAAVLTLSPPQLASLDQPTPSSSNGGPLDPLWHRLTHRPTPTATQPTSTSAPASPQPTPTGAITSSSAVPTSASSTDLRPTTAADAAPSPAASSGASTVSTSGTTPATPTPSDHTEAASQRVAQTSGSGSSMSLVLTVLGMLVAAAAVAATTVRSWSRSGPTPARRSAAPQTYQGRRRR